MALQHTDFDLFFEAICKNPPLPWQRRLMQSWSSGALDTTSTWADLIGIPTGLGKTVGVLCAWLFALATSLEREGTSSKIPRRFFHVVDRRVIVDESYALAERIHKVLAAPPNEACARVRDALWLSGASGAVPFSYGRMRGGRYSDSEWLRDPTRPAVLSTTVDQMGSALAFRKYMESPAAAPIYAGLASCDALVLLDEAHISQPFMRFLERIKDAHKNPLRPFILARMTATPDEVPTVGLDTEDFRSTLVRARTSTSKPTRLFHGGSADAVRARIVEDVAGWLKDNRSRIAVVRNTVKEARQTHAKLRSLKELKNADVLLLTGRCRPHVRDLIVDAHREKLATSMGKRDPLERPLVVVCTQCIEVGADFDFEAMATDAAPLDALLQRAGRLGRGGGQECPLSILKGTEDPVYGNVVEVVWEWLTSEGSQLDFCWEAMAKRMGTLAREDLLTLMTARPDNPTLTEDVLDAWAQSDPRPANDPSLAPFLHGYGRTTDVSVTWRRDLDVNGDPLTWPTIVSYVPPSAAESVPVPLWEVAKLLEEQRGGVDIVDDLVSSEEQEVPRNVRPFVLWRGSLERSEVLRNARQIRPGDTLVLPTTYGGHDEWGWSRKSNEVSDLQLEVDLARQRPRVRAHATMFSTDGVAPSWWSAAQTCLDNGDRQGVFTVLAKHGPQMVRDALSQMSLASADAAALYPDGNGLVFSRSTENRDDDDESSLAPRRITLNRHLRDVGEVAKSFSSAILGAHPMVSLLTAAGEFHDEGKADRSFQHKMRGRSSDVNAVVPSEDMLAKAQFRLVDNLATPRRWRHEFVSVDIADQIKMGDRTNDAELFRHLVGTHHGHGRCFAPPCHIAHLTISHRTTLSGDHVDVRNDYPFRRLDSDWVASFLAVNSRIGRWNVAFLETLLRLADWAASKLEEDSHV